jgi:hypothetical protein
MNRTALLVLAVLPLVACRPDVFDVEVKGETTIEGDPSPIPGLLNVFPGISSFNGIDFSQSQEFQNQGVTKDDVESVKATSIRLKIISPDTQDFDFLEQLQFFARAGDEEVLVGEKFGIDKLGLKAPNPVLELDLKDVELQPFVVAPSMSIVVRGRGRQPPQRTRLEATVNFDVQVKIL